VTNRRRLPLFWDVTVESCTKFGRGFLSLFVTTANESHPLREPVSCLTDSALFAISGNEASRCKLVVTGAMAPVLTLLGLYVFKFAGKERVLTFQYGGSGGDGDDERRQTAQISRRWMD